MLRWDARVTTMSRWFPSPRPRRHLPRRATTTATDRTSRRDDGAEHAAMIGVTHCPGCWSCSPDRFPPLPRPRRSRSAGSAAPIGTDWSCASTCDPAGGAGGAGDRDDSSAADRRWSVAVAARRSACRCAIAAAAVAGRSGRALGSPGCRRSRRLSASRSCQPAPLWRLQSALQYTYLRMWNNCIIYL